MPSLSTLEQPALVFNLSPLIGIREMGFHAGDGGPVLGEIRVDLDEIPLIIGHIFLSVDCIDRTLGDADCAIDALVRINDQEIRALAKAIYRTDIDTVGVTAFDTGFGDNVSHRR